MRVLRARGHAREQARPKRLVCTGAPYESFLTAGSAPPGSLPLRAVCTTPCAASWTVRKARLLACRRRAAYRPACLRLQALACRRSHGEAMAVTPVSCSTRWLAVPCGREAPSAVVRAVANVAAPTAVQPHAANTRRLPAAAARHINRAGEAACVLAPGSTHALPRTRCSAGAALLAAALTNGEGADLAPPSEDIGAGVYAASRRSCTLRTHKQGRRSRRR